MRAIDIRDLDIPEQDADYDELADFADKVAVLATDAIEAEPVRRGKWAPIQFGWYCSLCNYQISDRYGTYRYCPDCGALMEEQK